MKESSFIQSWNRIKFLIFSIFCLFSLVYLETEGAISLYLLFYFSLISLLMSLTSMLFYFFRSPLVKDKILPNKKFWQLTLSFKRKLLTGHHRQLRLKLVFVIFLLLLFILGIVFLAADSLEALSLTVIYLVAINLLYLLYKTVKIVLAYNLARRTVYLFLGAFVVFVFFYYFQAVAFFIAPLLLLILLISFSLYTDSSIPFFSHLLERIYNGCKRKINDLKKELDQDRWRQLRQTDIYLITSGIKKNPAVENYKFKKSTIRARIKFYSRLLKPLYFLSLLFHSSTESFILFFEELHQFYQQVKSNLEARLTKSEGGNVFSTSARYGRFLDLEKKLSQTEMGYVLELFFTHQTKQRVLSYQVVAVLLVSASVLTGLLTYLALPLTIHS